MQKIQEQNVPDQATICSRNVNDGIGMVQRTYQVQPPLISGIRISRMDPAKL